MRAIVKVWPMGTSRSTCIVIPKKMANSLEIVPGDYVKLVLEDGELKVKKVE